MDLMVKKTQEWLNTTYSGKKGYTPFEKKDIDGITGVGTFKRLIQALQIEINEQYGKNIKVDGDFGDGTLKAMPVTIGKSNRKNNIVHIIQSSLWCKGYSAGAMDGIYGNSTASAVTSFQVDAGILGDGIIKPYVLQGVMNTDGYKYNGEYDSDKYHKHLVQKAMNKYYGAKIGLTAPNGIWERKAHKNLIKCCQIEWGLTPDGVFGTNTMNAAPTLSQKKSGYVASKRLLKWGLTINGFYPENVEDGTFDGKTYSEVYAFQEFLELGADGIAGKNTWASLLSTRGNTARKATVCDTSKPLEEKDIELLKNNGYTQVGRYLTNTPGGTLNKALTVREIELLKKNNLKVFPIFQTSGRKNTYFSREQGISDAYVAQNAAIKLGFPKGTTIYFAADYDVLVADLDKYLIPYFKGINMAIGKYYNVGVYGPRMLCNELDKNKLAVKSFVSDMSSGFTGNIGQKMPSNWAYDQFYETKLNLLGIDKVIASSRATATDVSTLNPYKYNAKFNMNYYKALYNYAKKYIEQNYISNNITYDANILCLKYLRSKNYSGAFWMELDGPCDTAFNSEVTYRNLGISTSNSNVSHAKFSISDDSGSIEVSHLAATLNSYLHDAALIDDEKVVDAYAGWAGDLIQMCGAISDNDKKVFTSNILKEYMGDNSGKYCFSMEDLVQDCDAYILCKCYDWNTKSIYEIFDEYYNYKYCNSRFYTFKQLLLYDFDSESLKEVAKPFLEGKYGVYSSVFEFGFGACPEPYIDTVAKAFETRIDELIRS